MCSCVFIKLSLIISKVTTVHTLVFSNTLVHIPDVTAKKVLVGISLVTLRTLVDLLWFNTEVNLPFHSATLVVYQFILSFEESMAVRFLAVILLI